MKHLNLNRFTLAMVFLGCLSLNAEARIGETPEQCEQRYGKGIQVSGIFIAYIKNGFLIEIHFYNGYADIVSYKKFNDEELSDSEIDQLLQINSYQREWVPKHAGIWETRGRELAASYRKRLLVIMTKGSIDRFSAERKAKEQKGLSGF